ncbi:MAG TPA: hypothetical protein VN455_09065, partial [Methanotrichaceae archaeon]|nr:hypothetical protein [Methanotrichaceae archaeon]
TYTYEVVAPISEDKFAALASRFEEVGLTLTRQTLAKKGTNMIITWQAYGRPKSHQMMMKMLMTDADIEEVNIS